MLYARLAVPFSVAKKNNREVEEVSSYFKATRLRLGSAKLKTLEAKAKRMVEEWEEGTATLQGELRDLSKFIEGKTEETDFPFGAGQSSNIDVRYASAQSRTLRAMFIRSVFSDPAIVTAKVGPGATRSGNLNELEQAINWSLVEDTNAAESLKDTCHPIFRDGTSLVYGEWARKIERGCDYKTYTDLESFQADYPSAEDAGVSDEQYQKYVGEFSRIEDEGVGVCVEYELDFVSKNGPQYTTFPLAKFLWFPLYAKDMADALMYGYHYRQSGPSFRADVKSGFYDSEAAEKVKHRSGSEVGTWDSGQDDIEGIDSEHSSQESYEVAKLVVKADLDNDDIDETYVIYYEMESSKALRVERYSIRRNIPSIVPFRFIRRSGRILGDSILKDSIDLYREMNALHRHRSNVRRLTDSVTLLMPESLKDRVDLGAEYAQFKPGMTLWMPDQYMDPGKAPRQLQLYNLSRSNDSMDEEQVIMRYIDFLGGVSQGQSGKETGMDPSAPARKTAMLLQRSDMRGEDMLGEWARSIGHLVDLHRALIYQNSQKGFTYMVKADGEYNEKPIDLGMLADPSIRFALKMSRASMDPQVEMAKITALVVAAFQMQFPIQTKPQILVELWNRFIIASRTDSPEALMLEMSKPEEGVAPDSPEAMLQRMMGRANGNGGGTESTGVPGRAQAEGQGPLAPAESVGAVPTV